MAVKVPYSARYTEIAEGLAADGGVRAPRAPSDRRAIVFLVLASVAVAAAFILSGGSFFAPIAVVGIGFMLVLSFYRLDWGFILFIGMVLLFDQFPPKGYDSSIIGYEYFQNLKSFSFLASVDLAAINPIEVQLGLLFIIWCMLIAMGRRVLLQGVPVWGAALFFFFWLIVSAVYGMSRGGDFLVSLWELRALFYFGIVFFFVPQVIQERDQLNALIWTAIGAIFFKALQGIVRVIRLGFDFGERTELTNHEDPLFMIALFILLFGFVVYRARTRQKATIAWLLIPMIPVFILAQRRATYVALGMGIIAFMILIAARERNKMLRVILPGLAVFGVYLVMFWNVESFAGLPAQLVKSSFAKDKESAGERYYSNLYREFENYNLAQTLKKSPAIGIGFGNKYEQPIALAFIPFSLRDYIPHNEIYWLVVKMGALGFFSFWFFLDAWILQAAWTFPRLNDPYYKSVLAAAIIAVIGQVVVSYVDLQLTFYRNMIFLGLLMGLLPTLRRLDAEAAAEAPAA